MPFTIVTTIFRVLQTCSLRNRTYRSVRVLLFLFSLTLLLCRMNGRPQIKKRKTDRLRPAKGKQQKRLLWRIGQTIRHIQRKTSHGIKVEAPQDFMGDTTTIVHVSISFCIPETCLIVFQAGRTREKQENDRNLEEGGRQDYRGERRGRSSGSARGGGSGRGRGGGRAGGRFPPRGNRGNFNSRPIDTWDNSNTWDNSTATNANHTGKQ